jgi:inward rectifier potassium channel
MSLIRDAINRNRNKEDIGLDHGAQSGRQRTINRDGSYNMRRITGDAFNFELYHWLINARWSYFWLAVFLFYGSVNVVFASIYYLIGTQYIYGISATDTINDFMQCFFFSNQTFTTVGYGGMHPIGLLSSWVASLEAFIGLMSFALATGTLYGRFSKATSKVVFSRNAIIAPAGQHLALQFMAANKRNSNLMETEAIVNFSWVNKINGESYRQFKQLNLELSKIAMFPTSWTINHIIDEESPLYGMSYEDMKEKEIEVFVTLRGFDETFSQIVYSRMSFTAADVVYGAKFQRPFYIDETGKLVMDIRKVGSYDLVELPKQSYSIDKANLNTLLEPEQF